MSSHSKKLRKPKRQFNFTRYTLDDVEGILARLKSRNERTPESSNASKGKHLLSNGIRQFIGKRRERIIGYTVIFFFGLVIYLTSHSFVRLDNWRIVATGSKVKVVGEETSVGLSRYRGSYQAIEYAIDVIETVSMIKLPDRHLVFKVPVGTRSVVVRVDKPYVKLKVLEGEHEGQFGWISRTALR